MTSANHCSASASVVKPVFVFRLRQILAPEKDLLQLLWRSQVELVTRKFVRGLLGTGDLGGIVRFNLLQIGQRRGRCRLVPFGREGDERELDIA